MCMNKTRIYKAKPSFMKLIIKKLLSTKPFSHNFLKLILSRKPVAFFQKLFKFIPFNNLAFLFQWISKLLISHKLFLFPKITLKFKNFLSAQPQHKMFSLNKAFKKFIKRSSLSLSLSLELCGFQPV